MNFLRTFFSIFGLALVIGFVGCRMETTDRTEVSGTVLFKNQPLDEGTIRFEPETAGKGNVSGAIIKDGKYEVPRQQGLKPGMYKVMISSGEKGTKALITDQMPGESGPPAKERIPPEYNLETKQKVEVKTGQKNEFNFHIPWTQVNAMAGLGSWKW